MSGRERAAGERAAGEERARLHELLSKSEFFKGLDQEGLEMVRAAARERRLERGELCFRQGEPAALLYLVTRGRLKLTQLAPDGRQVILRLLEPGEMLGGVALFSQAVYPVAAEAAEPCELLAWDGRSMQRLIEARPKIALNVIEHLAGLVEGLQERVRELSTERAEQRIARALLRVAGPPAGRGEGGNAGEEEPIRLTRQELGELTGTTLYTVSRILSRWESEGLIASGRERITLLNREELERIAGEVPDSDGGPAGGE